MGLLTDCVKLTLFQESPDLEITLSGGRTDLEPFRLATGSDLRGLGGRHWAGQGVL
jgi:hypothetical protein